MENIVFQIKRIGFEDEGNSIDDCESKKFIHQLEENTKLNNQLNKVIS